MAEEQGVVTGIREDGWAQVVVERKDACECCGASNCCVSLRSSSEMVIKALNRAGANMGDLVSISLGSGALLKGAAVLYLIPLAGLMSGAVAGAGLEQRLAISETASVVIFGFAGLILGFILTILISRWMSEHDRVTPAISRIIKPGQKDSALLMAIDPVCKMAVSLADVQASFRYQDKTYYFCHPSCQESFMKNPEKYLRSISRDTGAPFWIGKK